MKTYVLDASKFSDVPAFYDEVSRTFGFSDEFGRNLDALWDCLTDRTDESSWYVWISRYEIPCEVVWKDSPDCGLSSEFRCDVFEIFREVDALDFRVE